MKKLTAGYAIMGASSLTVDEMVAYYESKNYTYPSDVYTSKGASTAEEFFTILKEEAENEGVKTEVLFAQVMLETGGLQFGGDVKAEQCNFGGLELSAVAPVARHLIMSGSDCVRRHST